MNEPLGVLGTPNVGFLALIIIGGLAGWIARHGHGCATLAVHKYTDRNRGLVDWISACGYSGDRHKRVDWPFYRCIGGSDFDPHHMAKAAPW